MNVTQRARKAAQADQQINIALLQLATDAGIELPAKPPLRGTPEDRACAFKVWVAGALDALVEARPRTARKVRA